MRAVLVATLVVTAFGAAAQTVDLVEQTGETFKQYSASVPIGSAEDGSAKDLDLEILVSSTGRVADVAVANAARDCIRVQVEPGKWLIIGCDEDDDGGFPPPVLMPVLVEVDPSHTTSDTADADPVANLTVRTIDLDALQGGQSFDLVPKQ